MKASRILGYSLAASLLLIGLLFAWASSVRYTTSRLGVALFSIASSLAILYLLQRSKPVEIVQRVELSGPIKAQEIACPYCSAPLDLELVKVVDGVPMMECPYCGRSFEVIEEPKW
jgi:DNA-directed RNA polymerase subunit RPC12/RpoP